MKSETPSFVFNHSKSEKDWLEKYDKLISIDTSLPFSLKNQTDWWLQNLAIRQHFKNLELLIRGNQTKGVKTSLRIVSWLRLSKDLNCDRATLKHPKRKVWVNKTRLMLLEMINESQVSKTSESNETLVNQLELQLEKQRTETSKWFLKYQEASERIEELNRLILNNYSISGNSKN